MHALTVWQPYAGLLVTGAKTVENRTWKPPRSLLRPGELLAIHAGARQDRESWLHAAEVLRQHPKIPVLPPWPLGGEGTPYGAILGVVTLAEVRSSPRPNDPWWVGPIGWYVENPTPLVTPLPMRGGQGLWQLDAQAELGVRRQLRRCTGLVSDLRRIAEVQEVIGGRATLRQARETAGLSIGQAERVTAIPARRIMDLEHGAEASVAERKVLGDAYDIEGWIQP